MDDIAVTIVNYNMKEDTARCLISLFKDLEGATLQVRVVVVDNASREPIAAYLAENFPQVLYVPMPENKGFGAGQNAGIRAVSAKYYFLLNPDTVFATGARVIEKLYAWMEAHPKVGMIGPKLLNVDGSLQYSCYRFPRFWSQPLRRLGFEKKYPSIARQVQEFLMKDFDHERSMPVDWIMGSAMFARAVALQKVGSFDERFFMYFEDCDWCRRFWETGWPVYYVHDIAITHGHRRASASIPGLKAVLLNPLTRIHIKSWLKYFWKWGIDRF